MSDSVDVLIVGQGICGSCLALQLEQKGKSFHLIDKGHQQATSRIAAGLINPITGRRYSKSWMIDTLLPYARDFYHSQQKHLRQSIYKETPIYRILGSARAVNYWDERSGDPEYEEYIGNEHPTFSFISGNHETGTVSGGLHIYMNRFIEELRSNWIERELLTEAEFHHNSLSRNGDIWEYENITAEHIVFCEGPAVEFNPFFEDWPWDFIKGEALYLRVNPELLDAPIKQTLFLIPWEEDTLWVGTTYEREQADGRPSEDGRNYLINRLDEQYDFEYEIIEHFAANRPAVHDHRPIIGEHPDHPGMYSFNGMGTKAASLAPWFASHFVPYIFENKKLLEDVDLNRFDHE